MGCIQSEVIDSAEASIVSCYKLRLQKTFYPKENFSDIKKHPNLIFLPNEQEDSVILFTKLNDIEPHNKSYFTDFSQKTKLRTQESTINKDTLSRSNISRESLTKKISLHIL